jgi:hypothetical protein
MASFAGDVALAVNERVRPILDLIDDLRKIGVQKDLPIRKLLHRTAGCVRLMMQPKCKPTRDAFPNKLTLGLFARLLPPLQHRSR